MLALLAPGQGAQTPGLLRPWLDLPGARERLTGWSALVDLDLLHLGTQADADAIRDTAVAQPLLTATALLSADALLGDHVLPDVTAGHSVGELSALAVAGVLTSDEAVTLAALRGRAMADAAAQAPTGMAALLGGDPAEVASAIARSGLEVATVNVAGQVVVGGPVALLEALVAAPPARCRVRLLEVAGAFHTAAMAPAVEPLRRALAALEPRPPLCPLVMNADGEVVRDGREALDRLVAQLTGPVRFDLCLGTLAAMGVTDVLELAPGGTLTALARRALPSAGTLALAGPDALPAGRAVLGSAATEGVDVDWHLLTAPGSGVVDPVRGAGTDVDAGDVLAVLTGRSGALQVLAPHRGTVTEWLVHAGDPVRAGQSLAVLA